MLNVFTYSEAMLISGASKQISPAGMLFILWVSWDLPKFRILFDYIRKFNLVGIKTPLADINFRHLINLYCHYSTWCRCRSFLDINKMINVNSLVTKNNSKYQHAKNLCPIPRSCYERRVSKLQLKENFKF